MAKKEYLKKKKTTENVFARTLNYMGRVGRLGFEPGMTEPKPVVLPLHHRPECGCKGSENLAISQIFTTLSYFTISK